nr:MAG TPA: hypothetical protein [Caudoviricetes sp.]
MNTCQHSLMLRNFQTGVELVKIAEESQKIINLKIKMIINLKIKMIAILMIKIKI